MVWMKDSISFTWSVNCVGGGERLGASHPLYLQRAPRLPDLLAHLRHHGSPTLCRQILQGESNHNLFARETGILVYFCYSQIVIRNNMYSNLQGVPGRPFHTLRYVRGRHKEQEFIFRYSCLYVCFIFS